MAARNFNAVRNLLFWQSVLQAFSSWALDWLLFPGEAPFALASEMKYREDLHPRAGVCVKSA